MQNQYQTFLNEASQTAYAQNAAYAQGQKAALEEYLDVLKKERAKTVEQKKAAYREDVAQADRQLEQAKEEARETERQKTTVAAVEHAIEQRNAEENIANWGISGSGLERAQQKAAPKTVTVSTADAEEAHKIKVDKLKAALDSYVADSQATLDKKVAEQTLSYEKRVGDNLQSLLKKAQSTATSLYKSENNFENASMQLGTHGEVTIENLYDEDFLKIVNRRLVEDEDDPEFLINALKKTLKYTNLSPRRIVTFIKKLNISESYQQMLALNVSREMYDKYWNETDS